MVPVENVSPTTREEQFDFTYESLMLYRFTQRMEKQSESFGEPRIKSFIQTVEKAWHGFICDQDEDWYFEERYDQILESIDDSIEQISSLSRYGEKYSTARRIFSEYTEFVGDHRQIHRDFSNWKKEILSTTKPVSIESNTSQDTMITPREENGILDLIGLWFFRMGLIEEAKEFVKERKSLRKSTVKFDLLLKRFECYEDISRDLDKIDSKSVRSKVNELELLKDPDKAYMPTCVYALSNVLDRLHYIALCANFEWIEALEFIRRVNPETLKDSTQISRMMRGLMKNTNEPDILSDESKKIIECCKLNLASVLCTVDYKTNRAAARGFNALAVCLHVGRKVINSVTIAGLIGREDFHQTGLELKMYLYKIFRTLLKLPHEPILYHTYFLCPVIRKPDTKQNPPVRLGCGHVVSKNASYSGTRSEAYTHQTELRCVYCQKRINLRHIKVINF
ncbi:hypothetical protein ACOME3_002934 [Neoechinorhynchus agilis]